MKKLALTFLGVALLAGCSAVQSPVTQEEVTLTPPSKDRVGYVRLVKIKITTLILIQFGWTTKI